jgi:hypothetical protein
LIHKYYQARVVQNVLTMPGEEGGNPYVGNANYSIDITQLLFVASGLHVTL